MLYLMKFNFWQESLLAWGCSFMFFYFMDSCLPWNVCPETSTDWLYSISCYFPCGETKFVLEEIKSHKGNHYLTAFISDLFPSINRNSSWKFLILSYRIWYPILELIIELFNRAVEWGLKFNPILPATALWWTRLFFIPNSMIYYFNSFFKKRKKKLEEVLVVWTLKSLVHEMLWKKPKLYTSSFSMTMLRRKKHQTIAYDIVNTFVSKEDINTYIAGPIKLYM
jgi:hypothetical protein